MRAVFEELVKQDHERRKELVDAIQIAVHNGIGEAMSKVFKR